MKKILSNLAKVTTGVSTSAALLTSQVLAQDPSQYLPDNFGPEGDLMSWVGKLINFVITLSGLVSVVILIVAGYMFITANGNEDQIKKATTTLTWAIVGLVVCLISVLLVRFVLSDIVGA